MKKLFLASAAALMMGAAALTGCSGSDNTASKGNSALGDSLAETFGAIQGAQFNQYINTLDSIEREKISKDDFLKGLKETLFTDTTSQGYMMGMNTGLNFLQEIMQIERQSNVRVDRKKLFDAFSKALNDTTIDVQTLQQQMQQVVGRVQEEMASFRKEQLMKAPEVKENKEKGEKFVASAKSADSSIKTTKSGLSYKVNAEGQGPKVSLEDKVKVRYTGKHVDGSVFDESGEEVREFYPAQVVPGFREALLMMNKGAKYTVYIPGDLAYGVEGQPMAGIGPMETLVFEIEVVDFENPKPVAVDAAAMESPAKPVKVNVAK